MRRLPAVVALLALAGCDVESLDPAPITPTAEVQPSAAAIGLVSSLIQAAVEDTIARGTDGNLSTLGARAPTNTTRTVDLDARSAGGAGADKFPAATGTFTLAPSAEAFSSSWPTGTAGVGTADLTISIPSGGSVRYTDPISGWTATMSGGSFVVRFDQQWNKDAGSTPATAITTATVATVPGSSLSLAGTASRTGDTDRAWTLTGTRSLTLKLERTGGQDPGNNLTTITAAALDLTVTAAAGSTRWQRSDATGLTITRDGTSIYSGAIAQLPASALAIHGEGDAY
jgi:hypothetical protein